MAVVSAYGPTEAEPWRHCGAVRQPFPDVCMALSTVWFLGPDDVEFANGGEPTNAARFHGIEWQITSAELQSGH